MTSYAIAIGLILSAWAMLIGAGILLSKVIRSKVLRPRKAPLAVEEWTAWSIGSVVAMLCVVTTFIPANYYEFPPRSSWRQVLAKVENGTVVVAPEGYGFWEAEGCCFMIPQFAFTGAGTVTALTENPKVRKVSYTLQVSIADFDKYYLGKSSYRMSLERPRSEVLRDHTFSMEQYSRPAQPRRVTDDIGLIVSKLMYEFNDKHSRELGEFYNPLDRAQNEQLQALIEPWMNERLSEEGLEARFAGFKVD